MLKKTLFYLLVSSNVFAAGIPTIDTAAIAQSLKSFLQDQTHNMKEVSQWVKEETKWAQDLAHFQKELQAYSDQLIASTGIKGSISSLKDIKDSYNNIVEISDNVTSFVDATKDPEAFLKDKLKETYGKYMLYEQCSNKQGVEKSVCMADFARYALQHNQAEKQNKNYKTMNQAIHDLDKKMRQSKDLKESIDINNAFASEAIRLQLQQAQLDNAAKMAEADAKLKAEQAKQYIYKHINDDVDSVEIVKRAFARKN